MGISFFNRKSWSSGIKIRVIIDTPATLESSQMDAIILIIVYIGSVAVFESISIGLGFVMERMMPGMSTLIFLGATALSLFFSWPLALWMTRNINTKVAKS